MQIVIDIDDEYVLSDIKNRSLEAESETDKVIINALYNGTPLPKGHGRLKDVDKFPVNEIERIEYNYECGENECHSEEIVYLDDIISAETIIEADKEDKNE